MTRDRLLRAAEEVETASTSVADPETADRLARLAAQLQSQASREATPALGALDRIQAKLGETAAGTDDTTVTAQLEHARDHIAAFLATLTDRGMTQHGLPLQTDANGTG